jgi:hypothetical protein
MEKAACPNHLILVSCAATGSATLTSMMNNAARNPNIFIITSSTN